MDSLNNSTYSENSDDEICAGPITKKEVIKKLEENNLLSEKLLKLLNKFDDNGTLNDILIAFYDHILSERGNQKSGMENNLLNDSVTNVKESLDESVICISDDDDESTSEQEQNDIPNIKIEEATNVSVRTESSEILNLFKSLVLENSTDQSQFNVSEQSELNDTLAEMEMLIKYGEHYMNEERSNNDSVEECNENINYTSNISPAVSPHYLHYPSRNEISEKNIQIQDMSGISNLSLVSPHKNDSNDSPSKILRNITNEQQPDENNRYKDITSDSNVSFSLVSTNHCNNDSDLSVPDTYSKLVRNISNELSHSSSKSSSNSSQTTDRSSCPQLRYNKENQIKQIDKIHAEKTPQSKLDTKSEFKIPSKMPSIKKSPGYKNIVSPIAMYIKNSPTVPLVKNIAKRVESSSCFVDISKQAEKSDKSSAMVKCPLPVRTYKPAKRNIFLSKENEPALPGNIRKLMKGPVNPEVIKHVGRVKATPDLCTQSASRPADTTDLTILSETAASEGVFYISTGPPGDVSLYISKNVARTNFLTNT